MSPDKYSNLGKFMINLAQDPVQLRDFKAKATVMMAQANLSPEEQGIVLSHDPIRLARALKPNNVDPTPKVTLVRAPIL